MNLLSYLSILILTIMCFDILAFKVTFARKKNAMINYMSDTCGKDSVESDLYHGIVDPEFPRFSFFTAVVLAAYAFESYNDPSIGKIAKGVDGTEITFTSSEFIRDFFSGVVMVTIQNAKIDKKEEELLERLATGEFSDPYVAMVLEDGEHRFLDSAKTTVKVNTPRPVWNESYFLYVKDTSTANVSFTVMDKDVYKEDDLIGVGSIPVSALISQASPFGEDIGLPVPIYMQEKNSPFGFFTSMFTSKRKRTGTLKVTARYIPWAPIQEPMSETDNPRPGAYQNLPMRRIAEEREGWAYLLDAVSATACQKGEIEPVGGWLRHAITRPVGGGTPTITKQQQRVDNALGGLQQQCFIQNIETDTQVLIWADRAQDRRHIIVSFRGTEQHKARDIMTDIDLAQIPFLENHPVMESALIHRGFLQSFRSVSVAVLQMLRGLLLEGNSNKDLKPWTLYVTGHSLGGALATLLGAELGRVREGMTTNIEQNDPSAVYCNDSDFRKALQRTRMSIYTFGAPRVGNGNFSRFFDSLVDDCFRVVNNKDVVARLPRGRNANSLLEYSHAGRTVMVDDDQLGALWIQGESAVSPNTSSNANNWCPIEDVSPFQLMDLPIVSNDQNMDLESEAWTLLQHAWDMGQEKLDGLSLLTGGISGIFNSLSNLTTTTSNTPNPSNNVIRPETILQEMKKQALSILAIPATSLNINSVPIPGGITTELFLKQELDLLSAIMDGRALEHHLEPSYYSALTKAAGLVDLLEKFPKSNGKIINNNDGTEVTTNITSDMVLNNYNKDSML